MIRKLTVGLELMLAAAILWTSTSVISGGADPRRGRYAVAW